MNELGKIPLHHVGTIKTAMMLQEKRLTITIHILAHQEVRHRLQASVRQLYEAAAEVSELRHDDAVQGPPQRLRTRPLFIRNCLCIGGRGLSRRLARRFAECTGVSKLKQQDTTQ